MWLCPHFEPDNAFGERLDPLLPRARLGIQTLQVVAQR
jgi:hypothetical protein